MLLLFFDRFRIVLCCFALHRIAWHRIASHRTAPHRTAPHRIAVLTALHVAPHHRRVVAARARHRRQPLAGRRRRRRRRACRKDGRLRGHVGLRRRVDRQQRRPGRPPVTRHRQRRADVRRAPAEQVRQAPAVPRAQLRRHPVEAVGRRLPRAGPRAPLVQRPVDAAAFDGERQRAAEGQDDERGEQSDDEHRRGEIETCKRDAEEGCGGQEARWEWRKVGRGSGGKAWRGGGNGPGGGVAQGF